MVMCFQLGLGLGLHVMCFQLGLGLWSCGCHVLPARARARGKICKQCSVMYFKVLLSLLNTLIVVTVVL